MSMRKLYIVCAFAALSLFFLGIQFLLFRYAIKQGKDEETGTSKKKRNIAVRGFENIKLFNNLCLTHGLPVFLIDPPILKHVMSNSSMHSQKTCKHLCNENTVTSFGILSQLWKNLDEIENHFRRVGFKVVYILETDPLSEKLPNSSTDYIKTHYIFERRSHAVHMVLFYERDKSGIWWHGSVNAKHAIAKGDVDKLTLNRSHIIVGRDYGAFDKMETLKVTIDGINVRAPRYPNPYLEAIHRSQFIECDYKRAQSFYAKFGKDASSDAVAFWQSAKDLISQAKKTLDELGIPFWISSGTCLGWFRQCDVIPYSKDVDFGIWIKDYDVRLIPAMQMAGMPIKHLFGKEADSYELSFYGGSIKLDIFFFYEEEDHVWNGGTQAKTGKKFKYTFPKFSLCWTEFLDMKVRVPCESRQYIEANYGTQWFEPVKEWDWKASPPNVQENGEWAVDERNKVIQHF